MLNGIRKWDDKRYCAMMIRLQLLGEPEIWLNQAETAGEPWVNDADEILVRMAKQFRRNRACNLSF